MIVSAPRLTSADLELLPENGKRYEVIEGELYVSKQPPWHHQYACLRLGWFLDEWSEQTGLGMANTAPGIIFAEDDDVALRGVQEYWIVDWRQRQVEVYRREQATLSLVATLYTMDNLDSPLLPGFTCHIGALFATLPKRVSSLNT